jgi:hypothetical protein
VIVSTHTKELSEEVHSVKLLKVRSPDAYTYHLFLLDSCRFETNRHGVLDTSCLVLDSLDTEIEAQVFV